MDWIPMARRGIKYRRENEHPTAAADVYEQNLATLGRVDDWQKRREQASQTIHSLTHPLILRRWQKCA